MIISISGTPGTGKTVVAKILAKRTHANLISIKNLIKKHKIPYILDKKRNTKVVDIKDIKKAVSNELAEQERSSKVKRESTKDIITFVEGHMAHFVPNKMTFVLVCDPIILKNRLQKRKWSEKKINENILAEILEIIISESKNPYKIDTSKSSPKKIADKIDRIINNPKLYKDVHRNWLKKYKQMVLGMEHN